MDRPTARDAVAGLVGEFRKGKAVFKDARKFDEAKVRAGFLDQIGRAHV